MIKKKLNSMPYANCRVEQHDDNTLVLVSYTTPVIKIKEDWLEVLGLYSMTTRRHISAFMKEYFGLSYSLAKELCQNREKINLITGEIVPV